jgi:hypothetical protein
MLFWILQKKEKKLKIQKYIFLGSTVIFHKKRARRINTSQTMSTEIKIEFQAVSGQTRHFWSKPSPSGQYKANHVDRDKN